MPTDPQLELEELGLLPAEAQVYLALIRNGPLAASAIANLTQIPRSSVYPTVNSLINKGLIQGGAGYGSRFTAVPPERALPTLVRHEREQLLHHETIVKGLSEHLAELAEDSPETAPEEVIQVIRSPRAIAERYERLQLEAERSIDAFTKPPFFMRAGDPAEEKAMRRGVHVRQLYEKAALEDPAIKPFLDKWLKGGEEARVFDGELPHKLAIFDRKVVLLPLFKPGEPVKTVVVRHAQLAESLSLAFQYVWDRSQPFPAQQAARRSAKHREKSDQVGAQVSHGERRNVAGKSENKK